MGTSFVDVTREILDTLVSGLNIEISLREYAYFYISQSKEEMQLQFIW